MSIVPPETFSYFNEIASSLMLLAMTERTTLAMINQNAAPHNDIVLNWF